ncbi:MAG: hypothetical protein ACP5HM_16735 [Anaerolineae bacterium]
MAQPEGAAGGPTTTLFLDPIPLLSRNTATALWPALSCAVMTAENFLYNYEVLWPILDVIDAEEMFPVPPTTPSGWTKWRSSTREVRLSRCCVPASCGFTWALFSQDGEGERLDDEQLLVRTLRAYGIETTQTDLEWFAEAFWAQSLCLNPAGHLIFKAGQVY